ncbi:MAG: glutamate 5-kinase [Eubacterium sp.]|nr:glutamate 5-kinase [Eubacterium sp.]
MRTRQEIRTAGRVVVKVGTSTITHENGRLDLRRLSGLSRVICDLVNSGKEVILVSSGAIGVGLGKLGLDPARPDDISKRQALASIGQCELMFIYDKLFGEYNHIVSQVLLTSDVFGNDLMRTNAENTFSQLLSLGIIPIVNENDTVATDELEGANIGDNDTLSAYVAKLTGSDILVLITDTDGLYSSDPSKRASPTGADGDQSLDEPYIIHEVNEITPDIVRLAGEPRSSFGTGGMATKIAAARIAGDAGIPCAIVSGHDPNNLYRLIDGEEIGTFFCPAAVE